MCGKSKVTGNDFDGGYAEFLIAPVGALAAIPDDLPAEEAGPFMCAGVTVYNALRNSGARAGEVVAVQGIGGLGHLGVRYARKMGFHTVALGRGKDKERWPESWDAPVYRFRRSRHRGRIAKIGKRARDSGDSAKRKSHLCCGRGPGREWESASAGRAR